MCTIVANLSVKVFEERLQNKEFLVLKFSLMLEDLLR